MRDHPKNRLILASRSAARRALLTQAGVTFAAEDAGVDEDAIKAVSTHLSPAELAVELASAKALAVSLRDPEAWVLGADQTLAFDGGLISKAETLDEAWTRLATMRGRTHELHSGLALARAGSVVWSGVETAAMRMRDFSDEFLDDYIAAEGEVLLTVVGSYRLEGMGAQLFESIDGDYFTVLGLPLWPLLKELRRVGVIAQ